MNGTVVKTGCCVSCCAEWHTAFWFTEKGVIHGIGKHRSCYQRAGSALEVLKHKKCSYIDLQKLDGFLQCIRKSA